jgi:hypothetical protein
VDISKENNYFYTKLNVMETLIKIQAELKCPKGSFNAFGKYKYRSAEQILESLKPLLQKHEATLLLSDEIVEVGGKLFLKATASFQKDKHVASVYGFAQLGEHKGMSSEQCTGTASSYARKYALNGLFLIDETESDPDSKNNQEQPKEVKKEISMDRFEKALQMVADGKLSKDELTKKMEGFTLNEVQQAALLVL